MTHPAQRSFLQSTKQKVIAGFIVASLSILAASSITYYGFNELLQTVDRLSEPNTTLDVLNNFFRRITTLDQELRSKALTNPKLATRTFLEESKALSASLDTLEALPWSDSAQYKRLTSMRNVLQKRNKLFLNYLQTKLTLSQNTKTSLQLDSLSQFLINYSPEADTNIVTTNTKTITTRYLPEVESEKEKGFFNRIFGKKKKQEAVSVPFEIEEELLTTVDTISMQKESKAIEQIGIIVRNLEEDKQLHNRIILQREVSFIDENTRLLNDLLTVLREVEQEELRRIEETYSVASSLANKSTRLIGLVLLLFLFSSLLLVIFILADITRTRYYRQQLIKAKEQAENLGDLKQQFLSNMSHEIRTPLQSIIGFSDLAWQQYPGNTAIHSIQKSSEHLLHIVNEILDFSRIESGKFKLTREPFRLTDVIDEVCQSAAIQAKAKNLNFQLEQIGVKDTPVLGDAVRLRQIMYNLIGNAIKFTPSGFVKLHVLVEDVVYRLVCTLSVSDSGIGIAEKEHTNIFNEFEQVNNDAQHLYGGSGIGLAIVKSLVEAQSGSIHITSKLGEGAEFVVKLGFDKAPAPISIEKRTLAKQTSPFSGKVLVVDDDEMILAYCEAVFKKNSISFSTYKDAKELLDQPVDTALTHVLLDIRMPEINGVELLEVLQNNHPDTVHFIAITAHALPEQQEELYTKGFKTVLLKPFRENDLLSLLRINDDKPFVQKDTINLSALHKLTFGDVDSLHAILRSFSEETTSDLAQLEIHLQQKNYTELREIVHRLAGRTGQMGYAECSKKLRSVESILERGENTHTLIIDLQQAKEEVTGLLQQVEELLQSP